MPDPEELRGVDDGKQHGGYHACKQQSVLKGSLPGLEAPTHGSGSLEWHHHVRSQRNRIELQAGNNRLYRVTVGDCHFDEIGWPGALALVAANGRAIARTQGSSRGTEALRLHLDHVGSKTRQHRRTGAITRASQRIVDGCGYHGIGTVAEVSALLHTDVSR